MDKRAFALLKNLRKSNKWSIATLREKLAEHGHQKSQPAVTKWEAKGGAPSEEVQEALAKIYKFNSRMELLEWLKNQYQETPMLEKIKKDNIAKHGDKKGQEINELLDRIEDLEKAAEVKRIKLFTQPIDINGCDLLSVGTSIEHHHHTFITAPPNITNPKGCFAIEIVSDSMAPRYMKGDIVFVDGHVEVLEGDDCLLVLEYPDENKTVAVCRTLSQKNIDDPDEDDRLFGHFGFATQRMYYEAHIEAEKQGVHRMYDGQDPADVADIYNEEVKKFTLTIGIWDDYTVQGMSNTGGRRMIIGGGEGYELGDIIPATAAVYKVVASYRKSIKSSVEPHHDEFNMLVGEYSGVSKYL